MAVVSPKTLHEDKLIELAMDAAPFVGMRDSEIREAVECAVKNWCLYRPHEVEPWRKLMRVYREQQKTESAKTPEGGYMVGYVPTYIMVQLNKFFRHNDWLHTNPKSIGILFDVLQEGRMSYMRGPNGVKRVTLDAVDHENFQM